VDPSIYFNLVVFFENYLARIIFFFKKTACEDDDFSLVVTQEIYQREQLLNRVRQLDRRAKEEEAYWIAEARREKELFFCPAEEKNPSIRRTYEEFLKEDYQEFVSARLYHQQQQEQEARLNSLYSSRASEEEWIAIQEGLKEWQPEHQSQQ